MTRRWLTLGLLLAVCGGCCSYADWVEWCSGFAPQTPDDKMVKTDNDRARRGLPLQYHANERQLRRHDSESDGTGNLDRREWERTHGIE